jgi:hypothetical protein
MVSWENLFAMLDDEEFDFSDLELLGIEMPDVKIDIFVEDEYITRMDVEMLISFSEMGMNMEMELTMVTLFSDFNQVDRINVPNAVTAGGELNTNGVFANLDRESEDFYLAMLMLISMLEEANVNVDWDELFPELTEEYPAEDSDIE